MPWHTQSWHTKRTGSFALLAEDRFFEFCILSVKQISQDSETLPLIFDLNRSDKFFLFLRNKGIFVDLVNHRSDSHPHTQIVTEKFYDASLIGKR